MGAFEKSSLLFSDRIFHFRAKKTAPIAAGAVRYTLKLKLTDLHQDRFTSGLSNMKNQVVSYIYIGDQI
jgi:hypothetical protein